MAAPKPEEISHPPMDQLQGLEYCIDSNPSWGMHISVLPPSPSLKFSFLGDKVRVVQTLLFVEGINTLLQTLFGTRLPTVIGGSYAFMVPIISIIHDPSLMTIQDNHMYLKNFQTRQLPILERFAVLISVTVIWAYAHLLTASGAYKHSPELTQVNCRTDKAYLISSAPWIKIPYPLQWGAPTLMLSTGAYNAASRLASATPPPAHVLSRGIGWQGIGILLDGLFGTLSGSTVSVENVGLLGSTRVGSRRVIQISAGFMIFFSMLASVGLSFLQFTNMNSMRNLFITGVAFFLGLSVPEYFRETQQRPFMVLLIQELDGMGGKRHELFFKIKFMGNWSHLTVCFFDVQFNDFLNTIFFSSPTVALIVAVFLDNTLDYKHSASDRGMTWWVRFRSFNGDSRNEEFYTLPFNLNRFFPPS
ncbi:hypothetical protein GH714_012599 [Hevea brasiliensis]|uniref:Nucleobase-ascorbate transporter 2 n=1 Tax=Hevea brasiliensis TaxID=3981 RepID=A0A6A6LRX6_HEVBR|nr:hypothetical protein GH714_012599 [Hevea brasiliensis]